MSTILQIKRTNTANLPSTLDQGELVYLYDTSATDTAAGGNGGRLMIGDPTSNTNTPIKIGGSYYTNLLDHSFGTAQASAAVLLDSDGKIDSWKVDNLTLDGNTISSTDVNGDILLAPNGSGKTVVSNLYVGDSNTSLQEYIEDITGGAMTAGTSLEFTYDDDAGTLTLGVADGGIDTAQLADNAVTTEKIGDLAVTSAKIADAGVTTTKLADLAVTSAKLADLSVSTGKIVDANVTTSKLADTAVTTGKIADSAVTSAKLSSSATVDADRAVTTDHIKDLAVSREKLADDSVITSKIVDANVTSAKLATNAVTADKLAQDAVTADKIAAGAITGDSISDSAITNAKLENDSVTLGSDTIALGETLTDISGLTSLDVDNITVDGNAISTTDTDGDLNLSPNGTGTIKVPSGYENRIGFSENSLANKKYVDQVASGLDVKESVVASTTANLDATYDNGTDGVGATLTANTNIALNIDGVTPVQDDRVLVKDQSDAVQNGIYLVTSTGSDGSTPFVLTRVDDADEPFELSGGSFFFIENGSTLANAGFVTTSDTPTYGTTDITFEQFSGAGQIDAGAALSKEGGTLNVETDDVTIEVGNEDSLTLKDDGITNAKINASAGIEQSKLSLNAATTRANADGIAQSDLGLVSLSSNQFTVTNGWAKVTRIDAGAYS